MLPYSLSVYLTCRDFYQVVDDEQQHTLVAASTLMPEIRGQLNGTGGANKVIVAQQVPISSCLDFSLSIIN